MTRQILHQSSWTRTDQGTDIPLWESTTISERPLLLVGGVHGDEPEGVELATQLLLWLQKNNNETIRSWILIPCLNMDGYKTKQRTNFRGVDLNRNFPTSDWSPEHKAARYFPGPKPSSELETQALVKLIEERKPELIVHFHSWEPCVVYTGKPGREVAEDLARDTGYEAREDIGYPTPGSLGQFGWLMHQTPVICIETQERAPLETVWPRFRSGLMRLLQRPKISAIAFDLDDTLLDTSHLLIPIFGTPAFSQRIREPLPLMPGAKESLETLKGKYKLFLVTMGDPAVQQEKIKSLGITSYFEKVYFADLSKGENKGMCFQSLLKEHRLQPKELLSVGNRRSAEIREAKRLGAWTCLFKHGEHILEKSEGPLDEPDFEISSHHEMIERCKL
jgi:protein MpaA